MKTVVVGAVIVAGAVCLFLYVQPLLTIRTLSKALKESNAEAIRDRMDFESVRQALKDEFIRRMDLDAGDADESAAAVLSLALISKGIEAIIATSSPGGTAQGEGGQAEITNWGYDTASRFHATIRRETDTPITFVLRRQGTSWRVTAMKPTELAWRKFELYRQGLTAEAETNLEAIFLKLAERHKGLGANDLKVIRIPRTPPQPPCGEPYTWTEDDIAAWEAIGFSPSGPVNYSYSVSAGSNVGVNNEHTLMVAEAVADLDCNGKISYFSLAMGENPDGLLHRPPEIHAEQRTE